MSDALAQQAPPETTTIRLAKYSSICVAPDSAADELLRAEGFTDIRYVPMDAISGVPIALSLTHGEIDFLMNFSPPLIVAVDAGDPITLLAGEHIGCFELFARAGIRTIPDLKGKNIGVQSLGSAQHLFISTMAAHVGLDPAKDIRWVTGGSPTPMELFAAGKIDAFLGLPPEPQELRGQQCRARDCQQRNRPPMVAVLLLHAGGTPGLRPQVPGRDQARAARDCQSR